MLDKLDAEGEMDSFSRPSPMEALVAATLGARMRRAGASRAQANDSSSSAHSARRKALARGDWLFTSPLFSHAAALGAGVPLERIFASALGRGVAGRNRPGPVFSALSSPQLATSVEGARFLSHAVGVAYAAKHEGDGVVAAVLRARDLNDGELHNAWNFAGVLAVPILFVVIGDKTEVAPVAEAARAYGMRADAMIGPSEMRFDQALTSIRNDKKPIVLSAAIDRAWRFSGERSPEALAQVEAGVRKGRAFEPPSLPSLRQHVYAEKVS